MKYECRMKPKKRQISLRLDCYTYGILQSVANLNNVTITSAATYLIRRGFLHQDHKEKNDDAG